MCLFNPEHLAAKVSDALLVLSSLSDDEGEEDRKPSSANKTSVHSPPLTSSTFLLPTPDATPPNNPISNFASSLQLDENGHSTTGTSRPVPRSLVELAALPCQEIIALIQGGRVEGLGIKRVEQEKERESREFYDEIVDGGQAGLHVVKQKLGTRIFNVLKGFKIKGAVSWFPV